MLNSPETFIPKEVREKLSLDVRQTYYDTNRSMREASADEDFIIDAHLMPTSGQSNLLVIEDAIVDLRRHEDAIDDRIQRGIENRPAQVFPSEWVSGRASLTATATYLEQRQKSANERMSYVELCEAISGYTPREIRREDLEEPLEDAKALLSRRGYRFNRNDPKSVAEAFTMYHHETGVSRREDIERLMRIHDRAFRPQLAKALGDSCIENFDFGFRWRQDNGPWMCWERGEEDGYYLDMNESRREAGDWDIAKTERYTIHEIGGHFAMLFLQAREIREGRLDSIVGVHPIPDPRCWLLEGIAQTLDTFAGLEISPDAQMSTALYRAYNRARTQALYELELEGRTIDSVTARMAAYTPDRDPAAVRQELLKIQGDLFWRVYAPIYGDSDLVLMGLSRNLTSAGREKVLQRIYRKPMTRGQFMSTPIEALAA